MNRRTYTFHDHAPWGAGPWLDEPDKVVWIDDATGLDAMMVRNRMGGWCGYVGVPPTHPWHGLDWSDGKLDVSVHGGLTFAARCEPGAQEAAEAICHAVAPGRPDDVWWFGFDCGHLHDFLPAMEARMQALPLSAVDDRHHSIYRDLEYVEHEVTDLARQLADVGRDADERVPGLHVQSPPG